MATLYISASLLKRDTALGSTVDDNLLQPYIRIAQDRWILPALGTQLDDKLKSDIAQDTLTGDYQTLVEDYISPALVQLTFAEVAYVVRLRFANNSVTIGSSEQGGSASMSDIRKVVEQSQEIGMFYRERLIEYLTFNSGSFPEYTSNTGADLSPSRRNYFGGLNVYPTLTTDNQLKAFATAIGVKYFNG